MHTWKRGRSAIRICLPIARFLAMFSPKSRKFFRSPIVASSLSTPTLASRTAKATAYHNQGLAREGTAEVVGRVACSPDGKRTLAGGDKTAKVWDAATGKHVRPPEGDTVAVTSVAFSRDGKRILAGGAEAKVWDAATGRELL